MDALKKAETMAEAATELKADLAERDSKITQLNSQLDKAKNQKHVSFSFVTISTFA